MEEGERSSPSNHGTLPPPPDGRPAESQVGMNEAPPERSDSEDTLEAEEPDDFLDYLPDRPEDEEEVSRERLPSILRGILEDVDDDVSEDSKGVPLTRRLPPAPEGTDSASLEGEPPDLEVLVDEDGDESSPVKRAATPKSQWSVLQRAKGALKKKKTSEPALLRSPSRLSEISTGSFIFEEDAISSQSEQVTCGRCRCEVSAACQCCSLYMISFLLLALIATGALLLQMPQLSLGAFGYLKQVDAEQGVSDAFFWKAWSQMLDLQSFSTPLIRTGNESAVGYEWHSLEVIWQMGPSLSEREKGFRPSVVSDTYMSDVKSAEEALKNLDGWSELCDTVALEVRFLCSVGDSLVALAFGTWKEASMDQRLRGLDWEVTFDAQGVPQLPVETLLAFAQQVRPELLERWLPQDSWTLEVAAQPYSRQVLRSTFLFYLPSEALSRFEELTSRVREALLMRQESSSMDGGLRGFYRIDGRDFDDLELSFKFLPLVNFAAANVFLTTLIFSRRLLLCLAALLLWAAASALSSVNQVTPITAITWQLLAVHAAEVALAVNSVLSYNGTRVLIKLQMFKDLFSTKQSERSVAWRWLTSWLQMPVQLFMPSLGMLLTFWVLNLQVQDIPMAQEFIHTTLPGILVILICGPSLFIPAILMGDWMAEARQEPEERWISPWLMPKELVWRPLSQTKQQRRRRRRYALFGILSYDNRAACPLLTLLVLILLVVTLTNIQEPLSTSTPPLFGQGELFREGQYAKAVLGALPSPERMLSSSLRNATACRVDADPDIGCSWFSCTGDKEAELPDDSCTCDFNFPFEASSPCTARALFSGTSDVPVGFWPWAQEQVGMTFVGNQTKSQAPPLEVEDWSSGQNLLQEQVLSSIPMQNLGVRCFRAICYCGPRRCVRPDSFQSLGVFPATLQSTTTPPNSSTVQTTDVFMIWGLQQKTSVTASSTLEWTLSPTMWAEPEAQRELLRTCLATPPDFEIVSRECFALDFQQWLEARGERYPVPQEDFSNRLESFAVDFGRKKYFWRSPMGGIAGTVARLRVSKSALSQEELVAGWQRYLQLRRIDPWRSSAWLAFQDSELSEVIERELIEVATGQVALMFVAMLALWTCVFTCSLRMALAAACSGGFCILSFFMCRALMPQTAVLQLLCLLVLVAALVAPLTRFLFFYSSARNGPGKRVKNERSHSFDELQDAMELTVNVPGKRRQSHSRVEQAIPRHQTQRLQSVETELSAQLEKEMEEQRRLAQVAAERKELQSLFRPSAINSERRNRSVTALCHSAEITMGVVLSLIFSWLTLWLGAPDALKQASRIFPVLAVIVLMVILCVSPVLILFGLGASRVWRQAFLTYMGAVTGWNRRFGGPGCSFPELRTPQDDELEINRSVKVLGWPFNRLAERSNRLTTAESSERKGGVTAVAEADTYGMSRQ